MHVRQFILKIVLFQSLLVITNYIRNYITRHKLKLISC